MYLSKVLAAWEILETIELHTALSYINHSNDNNNNNNYVNMKDT